MKPNIKNIFLYASTEHKTNRAVSFYSIPEGNAAAHVAQTNAIRRDHYTYPTIVAAVKAFCQWLSFL